MKEDQLFFCTHASTIQITTAYLSVEQTHAATWLATDDIELWEWPKKTWRGNCIAKKIKSESESRLSIVPASFAESCPKFQSATPSQWSLWHALCLSTWAFPWRLSETVHLELARAINVNLLASLPIFPDTVQCGGLTQKLSFNSLRLHLARVWLLQHPKNLTWCSYLSHGFPPRNWSRPLGISPNADGSQCTIESGGLKKVRNQWVRTQKYHKSCIHFCQPQKTAISDVRGIGSEA